MAYTGKYNREGTHALSYVWTLFFYEIVLTGVAKKMASGVCQDS
jgi:hypothetical protein